MGNTILVTGGCRSGKSAYAQRRAESLGGRLVYVATCPVIDAEMAQRIALHKEQRCSQGWETREEQTDLAGAIRHAKGAVVLVDCLTLWINNLMYEAEAHGKHVEERQIEQLCEEVTGVCCHREGTTLFVTNEVGMGIVPDNPAARRYRDLVGRANQTIAAAADEVVLVTCGIPITVKGAKDRVTS